MFSSKNLKSTNSAKDIYLLILNIASLNFNQVLGKINNKKQIKGRD